MLTRKPNSGSKNMSNQENNYDEPAGKQLFGADSNCGLVHEDGDYYSEVVGAFTQIN
jgi:hypothetical protein